jgi:hypothetical protein
MLGAVQGLVKGHILIPTVLAKSWFLCRTGP